MLVANNVIPAPGLFALLEEPGKLKPRFLNVLTLAFFAFSFSTRPSTTQQHAQQVWSRKLISKGLLEVQNAVYVVFTLEAANPLDVF